MNAASIASGLRLPSTAVVSAIAWRDFLIVRSYRRRYGLFACSGILYNHESPRRPLEFVPRKIAHAAGYVSREEHEQAAEVASRTG